MMRPLDEAEIRYMQKSVEKIYDRFTSLVSEGRDMPVERVDEIAQGRVWTGSEAVEIGLVDEIGTIEDAVDWALASIEDYTDISKVEIAQYPRPLTTLELLLGQLEGGENNILTGSPFESVGEAFGNWSTSESGKVYARIPYHITIR
jgi:protease-4